MVEIIVSNQDHWLEKSVNLFVDQAASSVAEHGYFAVALAGGNTPEPLYSELARPENWNRIEL